MQFLVILAILLVVVLVISAPLRAAAAADRSPQEQAAEAAAAATESRIQELEAAREAKYREIRDAELDYRTGKLSDEDFQQLDATLRAEAITILGALDTATARERQPA
jgi:Na+-transporting methylmalonyl-CoA/oxaloacetate decarboxylase gamma subunit